MPWPETLLCNFMLIHSGLSFTILRLDSPQMNNRANSLRSYRGHFSGILIQAQANISTDRFMGGRVGGWMSGLMDG